MPALAPWRPVERVIWITGGCWDEDDVLCAAGMESCDGLLEVYELYGAWDFRLVHLSAAGVQSCLHRECWCDL